MCLPAKVLTYMVRLMARRGVGGCWMVEVMVLVVVVVSGAGWAARFGSQTGQSTAKTLRVVVWGTLEQNTPAEQQFRSCRRRCRCRCRCRCCGRRCASCRLRRHHSSGFVRWTTTILTPALLPVELQPLPPGNRWQSLMRLFPIEPLYVYSFTCCLFSVPTSI